MTDQELTQLLSVLAGAALLGKVFVGAKHLYDNGRDIIYMKKGGIKKARDDFDSLNPTHVKYIWKGNVVNKPMLLSC